MSKGTGWVRYRFGDSASHGEFEWIFEPWLDGVEESEVLEHLKTHYETWAIYADHYSYEIFHGEIPPVDVIAKTLTGKERHQKYIESEIHFLREQLAKNS